MSRELQSILLSTVMSSASNIPSSFATATAPGVAALRRLRWLSHLLDNAIAVPLPGGGRVRFGLDPIMGLLPGAGDAVAAALSLYIVFEAYRLGASGRMIVRMLANVAIDFFGGSIPVLGDIFDFAWKCNARNLRLLEKELEQAGSVGGSVRA